MRTCIYTSVFVFSSLYSFQSFSQDCTRSYTPTTYLSLFEGRLNVANGEVVCLTAGTNGSFNGAIRVFAGGVLKICGSGHFRGSITVDPTFNGIAEGKIFKNSSFQIGGNLGAVANFGLILEDNEIACNSACPTTVISLPNQSICNGTTATFDAGNGYISYEWKNESGAIVGNNQLFTTSTAGNYTLKATNLTGCLFTSSTNVTVNPSPNIVLSNQSICGAQTATFDAGNTGSTYAWSNGANTQSIQVSAAGTYSVTVTSPQGCAASSSATLTVHSLPTVNLSNQSICSGQSATFNAGNTESTFAWSNGANTQSIQVTEAGTYSVTVTSPQGCAASSSATLMVHSLPIVNLNNSTLCGTQLTLNAGNPNSTYSWNTGATTQSIIVTSEGYYSVTVTNQFGCSSTDGSLVTKGLTGTSTSSVSNFFGSRVISNGQIVRFTSGAHRGAIHVYSGGTLFFENGASFVGSIQIDANATLITCGNVTITKDPWTNTNLTMNGTTKVFGTLTISGNYIFGSGSKLIMTQGSQLVKSTSYSVQVTMNGSLNYLGEPNYNAFIASNVLIVSNPSISNNVLITGAPLLNCPTTCTNTSNRFKVDETENVESGIQVFPNPATDFITIQLTENSSLYNVSLIDMNGENIKSMNTIGTVKFNISDLPSGLYLIKISSEQINQVHKISVK